jgi:hypothetical protein
MSDSNDDPAGRTVDVPPDAVLAAARRRTQARLARDWPTADGLRAEIEAAGWKVIDRGAAFDLEPAHPPTLEASGRVRYGRSEDVPSRLNDPAADGADVVIVAGTEPADLVRAVGGLRAHAPAGTAIVLVADTPDPKLEAALDELEATASPAAAVEIIRTSAPLGHAAALNAGLRRAASRVVVIMDPSVEPTGDVVTPLVAALADPAVGVAGGWGIVSGDLRQFEAAPAGDVDAIESYLMAFRRTDLARGPLDEKFRFYRNLDIWWSLVLRDEGVGEPPRRAVAVEAIPATRHEHRGWASLDPAERDRQSRRNFYRVIDRFGARRDLLLAPAPHRAGPGRREAAQG